MNNPDILPLLFLQPIDLCLDTQHPTVPLRPTSRLKYDCAPGDAKCRNPSHYVAGSAVLLGLSCSEKAFPERMPDGEADGRVFILTSPTVLRRIHARERTVTGMVAIESLVRVQDI
jgi:hypothetical protein